VITMAVISDIHAVADPANAHDSHVQLATRGDPSTNPLTALKGLVATTDLKADVLLMPGDVCNKADADALRYAWSEIEVLAGELGVAQLIATAGNHDMDSRANAGYDARGAMLELTPLFPVADETLADQYWARNITVVSDSDWRVVVLNSSAYHGYGEEWRHGRIADSTLRRLEAFAAADNKPVNVLLCHHHPQPWTHLALGDRSQMEGGDQLVELLDRADDLHWVMVHGHKHFPALGYLGASTSGPVRFSAGSVGAVLYPQLSTAVANQFYMLEFDPDQAQTLGLAVAGRFRAWDWVAGSGWLPAGPRSGLPAEGGFGYRRDGRALAAEFAALAIRKGARTLRWGEVVTELPQFAYVTPGDLSMFEAAIVGQHGGSVVPTAQGTILEVSLP
jgi:predicted phosphodiesterase